MEDYLRFAFAFIAVLGLIGVFAFAARRLGLLSGVPFVKGGQRLQVIEVAVVDARRRLVLVRRDGTEHLLLLGATGETVIETGIRGSAALEAGKRAAS